MKLRCLLTGHDWELAFIDHHAEDVWSWLLCCNRCGKWDETKATNQMVEFLKEKKDEW